MKRKEGDQPVSRRKIMKLAAGAIIVPELETSLQVRQPQRPTHQFFTRAEFAMVDELSELIIPTDDHSPGARAAKVAAYLDKVLWETWDDALKQKWREGLKLVNTIAREMHHEPFMRASTDQRIAVLERMAQNESKPQTPAEVFFVELKSRVTYAYYTSKIGIRQELEYKGNSYLREFAGEQEGEWMKEEGGGRKG